ncbi:amidase [Streptomyces sp. NPDC029526]|uniref:amidase n=1 Tax=Streptomyces sp. NPDC029526 TaxID=3155728 RepID=UPI0033D77C4A
MRQRPAPGDGASVTGTGRPTDAHGPLGTSGGALPLLAGESPDTAGEIARAVREGRVRAVDVVAGALERVERADPELCAFLDVWADEALRRAAEVDARVAEAHARVAAGRARVTDTDARVTAHDPQVTDVDAQVAAERARAHGTGSPLAHGSPTDLPLAGVPIAVKGRHGMRAAGPLSAAGAVVVGTTSVPGPGPPWQTWGRGAHGRTVNPWRADRTPGGSSAGAAVAVAAGLVPLATGSDGAGSVRLPAAWCGVVGLKVTNGRLPSSDRTGLAAPGVLARTARDAALWWQVVSAAPGHGGTVTGTNCDGSPPGGHRSSPVLGPFAPYGEGSAAPGTRGVPPVPPRFPVDAVWSPDLGFADPDPEPVALARSAVRRLVDAGVVRLVEPRVPPRLLDPAPAWLALRTGRTGTAGGAAAPTDDGTAGAGALRRENDARLARVFAEAPLLLTPTAPTAPHGHEGPGDVYSTALTWAFNLSGHPAASLPAGFGTDGCPAGLQVVAPHGREDLLLAVAQAAEADGRPRAEADT